ncbi:ANTAR domain-containing protein [Symbioplanes lichenis]|uniref:ANTAR domain-containing protein n=1 Tax=Symbioplanes lichenis TaxID=1629072 RepID=UPI002739023E|nr:ANTAR domain-containing protein [Actinoplanes lichenis]
MTQPSAAELATDFVRLNEFLRAGGDRAAALRRLVGLAVAAVPGCDWAAVTAWPDKAQPHSLAHSDDIALTTDQLQYDAGDGPCLRVAGEATVHVADLTGDDRWPAFRAAALARAPVRGVLSFPLTERLDRSALNLYSARPWAAGSAALTTASLFAAHARVLLLHAEAHARAAQLAEALTTSRRIGAAVGILMSVHKVTAEEAFALLRLTSQHLNRKLILVADDVTRTGSLPPTE